MWQSVRYQQLQSAFVGSVEPTQELSDLQLPDLLLQLEIMSYCRPALGHRRGNHRLAQLCDNVTPQIWQIHSISSGVAPCGSYYVGGPSISRLRISLLTRFSRSTQRYRRLVATRAHQ